MYLHVHTIHTPFDLFLKRDMEARGERVERGGRGGRGGCVLSESSRGDWFNYSVVCDTSTLHTTYHKREP